MQIQMTEGTNIKIAVRFGLIPYDFIWFTTKAFPKFIPPVFININNIAKKIFINRLITNKELNTYGLIIIFINYSLEIDDFFSSSFFTSDGTMNNRVKFPIKINKA